MASGWSKRQDSWDFYSPYTALVEFHEGSKYLLPATITLFEPVFSPISNACHSTESVHLASGLSVSFISGLVASAVVFRSIVHSFVRSKSILHVMVSVGVEIV